MSDCSHFMLQFRCPLTNDTSESDFSVLPLVLRVVQGAPHLECRCLLIMNCQRLAF